MSIMSKEALETDRQICDEAWLFPPHSSHSAQPQLLSAHSSIKSEYSSWMVRCTMHTTGMLALHQTGNR